MIDFFFMFLIYYLIMYTKIIFVFEFQFQNNFYTCLYLDKLFNFEVIVTKW